MRNSYNPAYVVADPVNNLDTTHVKKRFNGKVTVGDHGKLQGYPGSRKIDFVIILFQYFNLENLESEIPGLVILITASMQDLFNKLIGNNLPGQGFGCDSVVVRADQFAGIVD